MAASEVKLYSVPWIVCEISPQILPSRGWCPNLSPNLQEFPRLGLAALLRTWPSELLSVSLWLEMKQEITLPPYFDGISQVSMFST